MEGHGQAFLGSSPEVFVEVTARSLLISWPGNERKTRPESIQETSPLDACLLFLQSHFMTLCTIFYASSGLSFLTPGASRCVGSIIVSVNIPYAVTMAARARPRFVRLVRGRPSIQHITPSQYRPGCRADCHLSPRPPTPGPARSGIIPSGTGHVSCWGYVSVGRDLILILSE